MYALFWWKLQKNNFSPTLKYQDLFVCNGLIVEMLIWRLCPQPQPTPWRNALPQNLHQCPRQSPPIDNTQQDFVYKSPRRRAAPVQTNALRLVKGRRHSIPAQPILAANLFGSARPRPRPRPRPWPMDRRGQLPNTRKDALVIMGMHWEGRSINQDPLKSDFYDLPGNTSIPKGKKSLCKIKSKDLVRDGTPDQKSLVNCRNSFLELTVKNKYERS